MAKKKKSRGANNSNKNKNLANGNTASTINHSSPPIPATNVGELSPESVGSLTDTNTVDSPASVSVETITPISTTVIDEPSNIPQSKSSSGSINNGEPSLNEYSTVQQDADSEFDKLADGLNESDTEVQIVIPQKSIARSLEPDSAELLEATHETVQVAMPVEISDATQPIADSDSFDPDLYFSGTDDEIIDKYEASQTSAVLTDVNKLNDQPVPVLVETNVSNANPGEDHVQPLKIDPIEIKEKEVNVTKERASPVDIADKTKEDQGSEMEKAATHNDSTSDVHEDDHFDFSEHKTHKAAEPVVDTDVTSPSRGMIRKVSNPDFRHFDDADLPPLESPVASPERSSPIKKHAKTLSIDAVSMDDSDDEDLARSASYKRKTAGGSGVRRPPPLVLESPVPLKPRSSQNDSQVFSRNGSPVASRNGSPRSSSPTLAQSKRLKGLTLDSPSSPFGSPRPYKYMQSPLPKDNHKDPPIFGVCVVGFHHQRGPEVEYWVGPDRSHAKIWPYLPFQSLPDGSHQFEENICYFTLLFDRNKSAATSLTFDRDENGNIKEGTSDFRNVTTLFAIACSRQVKVEELENVANEEEYTRTIVQKSVVVIASKPIFGPIKEKLTVVTRSYFQQKNFSDRSIIDHFYDNMMQMPLWINDNDSQVGMNLQRFVYDFNSNVLVILKAMLLELKILFYAQDTDVLGTTQFALVSLVPNLMSHLEDSGSPLLSSYELHLRTPQTYIPGDRTSLLEFMGFPLQLFAAGGLFAPFVPLQQFEELRQPETRYGLMGTTNNLFLGTEIDFDLVVNIDTKEVQIRNTQVAPLLKLSDPDTAFINNINEAVKKAWDTEETWQPEALGYYGGEDYIRHEFEEYLLALLASAKYARLGNLQQEMKNLQSKSSAASLASMSPSHQILKTPSISESIGPKSVNEGGASIFSKESKDVFTTISEITPAKAREAISPWNRQWAEHWMHNTNNFRIFDQHTVPEVCSATPHAHPGFKHIKPSGFARFFGMFKSKPAPPPALQAVPKEISTTASPSSSVVQTPTIDKFTSFEPQTPQHLTFSAIPDSDKR